MVCDKGHILRSKLRVDARFRLMAVMAPKKYGNKVFQEITGADGGSLVIEHRLDWKSLSDEEIEAIEAFARAAEKRHQIERGARPVLGTDR